ncbi:hypothetical protein ACS0TY_004511 [Phlomoides rotata]
MVSPHGVQLAGHLISCYYGDLCSKVCQCLLNRGSITLAQIARFTELTRDNVQNCLRVLVHQNYVQAFALQQEGGFGEAPRIVTHYMALFENIIHKLRAPKFMQIVSEELGNDCLEIFQGFIEHGRISVDQIINRKEEIARRNRGSFDANVVRENFRKLLNARFIERRPAPEPYLAPPSEEDHPAKKRGAKSAKIVPEQTLEQRALAAAAPMESLRFLMEMDDLTEEKGGDSDNTVAVGKKRKQDVLKSDDVLMEDADKKKEVLFRVNFEEFMCRLRHKACISYVKTRFNDEASIVLSAVLGLSSRSERQPKAEKSAELSINAIYDEVIKKEGGLGLDVERVITSLEQLGCETHLTDSDDSYCVDIKDIIERARNEEVESMVLRRYGREAYRIFKHLSKAGRFLETDWIADKTFVEKKDAIMILYKLWKDDYVQMEKSSTGGVRPSVLLQCKISRMLQEKFLDELYHAALNLRLRIAHEKDQAKEVLQLPKEKLVGELKRRYELAQKVRIVLESSLINLDDAIMLFQNF